MSGMRGMLAIWGLVCPGGMLTEILGTSLRPSVTEEILMADFSLGPSNILDAIQNEMLVRYFAVAGGTLFMYDVLTNFDLELEYIWTPFYRRERPKASMLIKLLYLAQRYLPFVDQVVLDQYILQGARDSHACAIAYSLIIWISFVGIMLSEIILGFRVWAVWERKSLIAVILVTIFLGCFIPAMVLLEIFKRGIQIAELNITAPDQLRRCFAVADNKDIYLCWILLMIYISASFILMAIPGYHATDISVSSFSTDLSGTDRIGGCSRLVQVVYRDGIIYFALIFMVSLVNVTVILILPTDFVVLVVSPLERVLHSILTSRAIIHIRKVVSRAHIQFEDVDGRIDMEVLSAEDIGILVEPNMIP
ncbi:hypothetical protein L218DRAFT_1003553 [Marasmius fiardii PR-910]|nr:hypothetical protein L218DRAFT_1003553 [Marasmius fiardii PR-910]